MSNLLQHKSYKFRIYPNKTQSIKLNNTFGCVRYVWNQFVESFNKLENHSSIKELRNINNFLKEVSAGALQQKERDFIELKKQYFNKKRKTKIGRPQFKSKKKSKDSYRLPNQKFQLLSNKIKLEKIGNVKIKFDRVLPEDVKFLSCTISRNKVKEYYVSVLVEQDIISKEKTNKSVGLDLGIKEFMTTSDGLQVKMFDFGDNQAKIKHLQRHLARKNVGSTRFNKVKNKIAKEHLEITRKREWLLHQISNYLVNNYDKMVIEDLNISGMMKNHKLAGAIQKQAWSIFVSQLQYKAKWYDKEVIKINRWFPSSKLCSICGCLKDNLKLSDRVYTCDCGNVIDRDLNASLNILFVGVNTNYRSWMECKTNDILDLSGLSLAIPNEMTNFLKFNNY